MYLRTKFALLLSISVLLTTSFATLVLCRFFVADYQGSLGDFQSSLAQSAGRALKSRLDSVYHQVGALIDSDPAHLPDLVDSSEGRLALELWKGTRAILVVPPGVNGEVPPDGASQWALLPRGQSSKTPSLRWIGRYGDRSVVLTLGIDWFSGVLEASHGASISLLTPDGTPLLSARDSGLVEDHAALPPELLREIASEKPELTTSKRYRSSSGQRMLGTFVVLDLDPALLMIVSRPWSTVESVMTRIYWGAVGIAGAFLIAAVAVGVLFSRTLTRPLHALAVQAGDVGHGNFNVSAPTGPERADEVGLLTRSFRDMVGELNKMRNELRKSERMAAMGKFSASVAHEIKNPLSGILGNAQVVRDFILETYGSEAESALQALAFVEEETLRANRILVRLMTFARNERPPDATIDLSERVRRSVAMLRPEAERNGATLLAEIAEAPVACVANGDQIHEVLINLIQNALHAVRGSTAKRIKVTLREEGNHAILSVEDTGAGITDEVREHLFEPFFTTKAIGEGTGLGLAVCHGIVTAHRGKFEVVSDVGKGTTFFIQLPLAPRATFPRSEAA